MNLIRMNLYRFMKTKSVYILLLITALLVGILVLDQNAEGTAEMNQEIMQQAGIEEDESVGLAIGFTFIASVVQMSEEMVNSGMLLMFTAIFAVLFSYTERMGGYLKNLNSCAGSKAQIFIAKIAPVMLFVALNLVVVPLTAKAFGLSGGGILTVKFAVYMAVQWLIHVAFGVFFLMLMEITRSLVVGLLCGVFLSAGAGLMLVNLVESMLLHMDGVISSHMLVSAARAFLMEEIPSALIPTLLSGVVALVIYTVIGVTVFKKRDI